MDIAPPPDSRLNQQLQRTLPATAVLATRLPLCPEIQLYLIDPANMQRAFNSDEIRLILQNTPYWCFCWASGQALAYYLLRRRELCAGKRIVDFGAGSGVVAIAAALAGAAAVTACDIDPDALAAVQANAALNNVAVACRQSIAQIDGPIDLIIAADVLYDRDNFHYLAEFLSLAPEILVADSRVKNFDVPPYRHIAAIQAATWPELEEAAEFRRIAIYRAGAAA